MREQRQCGKSLQRHATSPYNSDRKGRPVLTPALRPKAWEVRFVAWAGAMVGLAGLNIADSVQPAFAHVDEGPTAAAAWSMWQFTPDIVIATMLVTLVYIAGMARRRGAATPPQVLRHTAFLCGLAVVFLALQSPVDTISEHLFAMHQVQHLLLRMVAPMLIVAAAPQATLIAGLPSPARKAVMTPLASNRGLQMVFALLAHPLVVTTLFIGVLYFWEIPRYHELALLNEPVHYAMHGIMLIAGLLFWWRIFDRRGPPMGLRYGIRLMLLWIALLADIILGAYTTLKTTVLYPAYDLLGRFWEISPSVDEHLGGIIIWIPGSMMYLAAILTVVHMWGRHESRIESRQAGGAGILASSMIGCGGRGGLSPHPISADDFADRQKSKNRTMALGFAAFAIAVFSTVLLVGVVNHLVGTRRFETASQGFVHALTQLLSRQRQP